MEDGFSLIQPLSSGSSIIEPPNESLNEARIFLNAIIHKQAVRGPHQNTDDEMQSRQRYKSVTRVDLALTAVLEYNEECQQTEVNPANDSPPADQTNGERFLIDCQ